MFDGNFFVLFSIINRSVFTVPRVGLRFYFNSGEGCTSRLIIIGVGQTLLCGRTCGTIVGEEGVTIQTDLSFHCRRGGSDNTHRPVFLKEIASSRSCPRQHEQLQESIIVVVDANSCSCRRHRL